MDMTRRRRVLALAAGAVAACGTGLLVAPGAANAAAASRGPVTARTASGSFGQAIELPGLGALNTGGDAAVASVSCGKSGVCAAGGQYTDGRKHVQGFVAVKRRGQWGKAIEVPGLGALNKGGNASVVSVSCGPAGSCTADGSYKYGSGSDGTGHYSDFVVGEKNGVWSKAIQVPGLGALNTGGFARAGNVSCAPAGNCAAVGSYTDASGHHQGFVVSEKNGIWGQAIEVPGLGALNAGGGAGVSSVYCASAGNCTAVGGYADGNGHQQGFTAEEKNGVWGNAIEVPGLEALNTTGDADVLAVGCASPGNCTAGGYYSNGADNNGQQGFVVSEQNGTWGQATDVPGLAALNSNGGAFISSVSCASAGNCTVGGDYDYDYNWGFVAVEKNGVWGRAMNAPGLNALDTGRYADVNSVSCPTANTCAAAGDYEDISGSSFHPEGFAVSERNGQWSPAIREPGPHTVRQEFANAYAVSCAAPGNCTEGGYYSDGHDHRQGFVTR